MYTRLGWSCMRCSLGFHPFTMTTSQCFTTTYHKASSKFPSTSQKLPRTSWLEYLRATPTKDRLLLRLKLIRSLQVSTGLCWDRRDTGLLPNWTKYPRTHLKKLRRQTTSNKCSAMDLLLTAPSQFCLTRTTRLKIIISTESETFLLLETHHHSPLLEDLTTPEVKIRNKGHQTTVQLIIKCVELQTQVSKGQCHLKDTETTYCLHISIYT